MRPVLLDIDIDFVVPMYLHMNMGITVKHHDLLKIAIHAIDLMLARQFAEDEEFSATGLTQFDDYVAELRPLMKAKKERARIADCLTSYRVKGEQRDAYKKKHTESLAKISALEAKLENTNLKPDVGPLANSIDVILKLIVENILT